MTENEFYESVLSILREMNQWIKIASIPKVKEILDITLLTPEAKKIYHHSDGKSSTEIAKIVGISQPTVSNYWNKWSKIGIVHESSKFKGRWEKSFQLEDFGISYD